MEAETDYILRSNSSWIVTLPLLLLLLAVTSATATSKPLDVTVDQLVTMPEQFNGKRVSVTGYFDTTVHHGCDLRARRKRSDDPRQYINIVIPDSAVPGIRHLTHDFTRVVRAHIVGRFQYRYVGPIKETPVSGDAHVHRIVTIQTGFGWEGLWDKQITKISDFRVSAR
jgi:hypothetical protein